MTDSYLLPILLAIPFLGALVCAALPARAGGHNAGHSADRSGGRGDHARALGVLFALATLGVAAALFFKLPVGVGTHADQSSVGEGVSALSPITFGGMKSADGLLGIERLNFSFRLGLDSVSSWLVLLACVVTPIALVSSSGSIHERSKEFTAWMLVLLGAILGVFVARDVLLFYVFFELTLIPALFLIGIWGGPAKREAAYKFFIYTFAGSVFLLIGLVYVAVQAGGFGMEQFLTAAQALSPREQFWVGLAVLVGFLVKTPVFPLHTWQALTYAESPAPATVIFAAVLSKLGTYGLLRLSMPVAFVNSTTPFVNPGLLTLVAVLAVIGILYGGLVAWAQRDYFRLLAFSSLSHLGFCVLGMCAMNTIGLQGSILYMVNHGITTAALFLCLGFVQERLGTREIAKISGLFKAMPVLSVFWVLFTMASIGLPGLNGFPSEFATLQGAFVSPHLGISFGVVATLGVILGAIYMLHLTAKLFFGPLVLPAGGRARDLSVREASLLLPLAVLCVVLGVQPGIVSDTVRPAAQATARPLPVPDKLQKDLAGRIGSGGGETMQMPGQDRPSGESGP